MDSIVWIIIFILISIISSVLEKNKKNKQRQRQQGAMGQAPQQPPKKDRLDVFQELFGIPKPATSDESYDTYSEQQQTKKPYQQSWSPEDEFDNIKTEVKKSSKIIPQTDSKKTIESQEKTKHEKKKTAALVVEEEEYTGYDTSDIMEKIKSPESLKDLIVITEILNKPKALRRR